MATTTVKSGASVPAPGVVAWAGQTNSIVTVNANATKLCTSGSSFRVSKNTNTNSASASTGVTTNANSSGTYGKVPPRKFIAMTVTTEIAGISNSLLKSAGASLKGERAINLLEKVWTRQVVLAGWNYSTGHLLSTPTNRQDSFGNDDAARPTMSVPGEIAYANGKPNPVQDEYAAKTG